VILEHPRHVQALEAHQPILAREPVQEVGPLSGNALILAGEKQARLLAVAAPLPAPRQLPVQAPEPPLGPFRKRGCSIFSPVESVAKWVRPRSTPTTGFGLGSAASSSSHWTDT